MPVVYPVKIKIERVDALPHYRLRIEWENGQEHIIELGAKIITRLILT